MTKTAMLQQSAALENERSIERLSRSIEALRSQQLRTVEDLAQAMLPLAESMARLVEETRQTLEETREDLRETRAAVSQGRQALTEAAKELRTAADSIKKWKPPAQKPMWPITMAVLLLVLVQIGSAIWLAWKIGLLR